MAGEAGLDDDLVNLMGRLSRMGEHRVDGRLRGRGFGKRCRGRWGR